MTAPSSSSRSPAERSSAAGPARASDARLYLGVDLAALRGLRPWLETAVVVVDEEARDSLLGRLELATHELCVNIVEHAYGDAPGRPAGAAPGGILVELWNEEDAVVVRTLDEGRPCDGAARARPLPG